MIRTDTTITFEGIEHRIEHRIDGKRCKLTIIIENQLTFLFLYRY